MFLFLPRHRASEPTRASRRVRAVATTNDVTRVSHAFARVVTASRTRSRARALVSRVATARAIIPPRIHRDPDRSI